MENHGYAYESYGTHDGFTIATHNCIAKNDERSWNQERDGTNAATNECQ